MAGDLNQYTCSKCGNEGFDTSRAGRWVLAGFSNGPHECGSCGATVEYVLGCSNYTCWELRCIECAHKHLTDQIPHECENKPPAVIHNPETCPGCPDCGFKEDDDGEEHPA